MVTDRPAQRRDLAAIAAEVARNLAYTTERPEGTYICTPVMYQSGAAVTVRLFWGKDRRFIVSDAGAGFEEAMLLGGESIYSRIAGEVARNAGVKFDGHSIFELDIAEDQLVGAVATIANCSQEAVFLTAQSAAERRHTNAGDLLYRRLFSAFRHVPSSEVVKDHEIIGASTTPHKFDSLVRVRDSRALFGYVEAHANSVAAAVTKFGDVKRLDDSPARVAVVRSKAALGTRFGLLAPVCSVVEQSVPDETFVRILRAA